jgi:hypothetical protein
LARSVVQPAASLPIERPGRGVGVRADDLGIDSAAATPAEGASSPSRCYAPGRPHLARPLVRAVIDLRLDRLTERHPDLLHHIEGRVTAGALADILTDLPAGQILTVATDIAERTGAGINTVATTVLTNLERALGKPVPSTPAQQPKTYPAGR